MRGNGMLLALDIGNSRIKGGLFEGASLVRAFQLTPEPAGGLEDALRSCIGDASVQHVGLSSVRPAVTPLLVSAARDVTGREPIVLHAGMPLPLRLCYRTPQTLGLDRLAAACGAWARYGKAGPSPRSVAVIDAGTAITYEVIDREGRYLGGAIGPGPALMRQALNTGTAQLPDVPLELPEDVVGRSTVEALQSGILFGFVDAVDGMLRRIEARLGERPFTVATGGWGPLLRDQLSGVDALEPHLVLHGIRTLVEHNAGLSGPPA